MSSPSSTEALTALAGDMAAFLDAALIERVPERDIPAAESLCVRAAEMWPVQEDGWKAARGHVTQRLAEHYDERVSAWARALYLVALYLDYAWFDEPHPREDTQLRIQRRGQQLHRVELGLAQAFAEVLLVGADGPLLTRLFDTLDEWDAWFAVARALEQRRPQLDADAIVALLTRAIEFAWGDSAANEILDRVKLALAASPASVDAILNDWLGAEEPYADVDVRVIGLLALWRLPECSNATALRRRLVHQFVRLPPIHGPGFALRIAFRGWPPDVPFAERRDLLLATLERVGSEAVSAALGALVHDPDTPRVDALELLDAIMKHASTLTDSIAIEFVQVLRWIADGPTEGKPDVVSNIDMSELVRRLPPPEAFSLRSMPWLDRALSTFARRAIEPVRDYVLDWIETRADVLVGEHTLTRLLARTRKCLPSDDWLINAAVSHRSGLRRGAIRCLVDAEHHGDRQAGFEALSPRQVHGLALLMLSQATVGVAIVDLLFELARARPDCLEVLGPLLGQPTMHTYPGRQRRCVEAWAKAIEGGPADDPQVEAVAGLEALLAARERDAQAVFAVRELLFEPTLPARGPTMEVFTRQMREAMRTHESPLRALATKVPIACGGSTTSEFGDGDGQTPTPLTNHYSKMEGLFLEAYDPVAGLLARMEHEQAAQHLLDSADPEDSP